MGNAPATTATKMKAYVAFLRRGSKKRRLQMEEYSTTIQSAFRSQRARQDAARRRAEYQAAWLEQQRQLERDKREAAAVAIQSPIRGYQTRIVVNELRIVVAEQKEIARLQREWDDKKNARKKQARRLTLIHSLDPPAFISLAGTNNPMAVTSSPILPSFPVPSHLIIGGQPVDPGHDASLYPFGSRSATGMLTWVPFVHLARLAMTSATLQRICQRESNCRRWALAQRCVVDLPSSCASGRWLQHLYFVQRLTRAQCGRSSHIGVGHVHAMFAIPDPAAPFHASLVRSFGNDEGHGKLGLGEQMYAAFSPCEVDVRETPEHEDSFDEALRRVVSVSCGDHHSFLLFADGSMASFGHSNFGQLGLGSRFDMSVRTTRYCDSSRPRTVETVSASGVTLTAPRVVSVACGHQHTVVVTEMGRAFACGNGSYGQLGLGHLHSVGTFSEMDFKRLPRSDVRAIVQVACGGAHTALVTDDGRVMTCGNGEMGQLGQWNAKTDTGITSSTRPQYVAPLSRNKKLPEFAIQAACGSNHSLVLCRSGRVFAFGDGRYGQLGLGSEESVFKPQAITSLQKWQRQILTLTAPFWPDEPYVLRTTTTHGLRVAKVVAARRQSAIITDEGALYTMGCNTDCQLGIDSNQRGGLPEVSVCVPTRVDTKNDTVADVGFGPAVMLVATSGATPIEPVEVWSCGASICGQLGHGQGADAQAITRLRRVASNDTSLVSADTGDDTDLSLHTGRPKAPMRQSLSLKPRMIRRFPLGTIELTPDPGNQFRHVMDDYGGYYPY